MIITKNSARLIVLACSVLVLTGCGGGKSTSQPTTLSAIDIQLLNFTSGDSNFSSCTLSSLTTVLSCLNELGTDATHTNGWTDPSTVGHFFYDSGHMQVLANNIGLGPDNPTKLAIDIQSIIGTDVAVTYPLDPQLAGGGYASPYSYAQFLRNMLGGTRYPHMLNLLGSHTVCTNPSSTLNATDCLSAPMFSPVNQSAPGAGNDVSSEYWHYSLGHWVEDDPGVGDGAFSSPGRFGFYPWIDKTKTYYGILARYDTANTIPPPYYTSVVCGRLIRKAWESGTPATRVADAKSVATTDAACTSITGFYWEIGDANGLLASGTGGSSSSPNPALAMSIASASKWLFSTYVVERLGVQQ